MIKAALLDLDDTLISANTNKLFSAYLKALGDYGASVTPPETFAKQVMSSFTIALRNGNPLQTLYEKFMPIMASATKHDEVGLAELFSSFYADCYAILEPMVKPRDSSQRLIDWLATHNYPMVVATNPGLPESAIYQRMKWGGIAAEHEPFALITTLETMHFGKPTPEYYEEIMARLALSPGEAIMVGDDWANDIVGAAQAGLHTFWITHQNAKPPDPAVRISGSGSYDEFVNLVVNGWLDTLEPLAPKHEALIHRLIAFPASIDALRRNYRAELLECPPSEGEWSARDIVCHLRDHEATEDRARLERIILEDNPFLSANYDPWAHAHEYSHVSFERALIDFARSRVTTVEWLKTLPPEAWSRPARYAILGPTHFEEMVRFTTEHDLTHLRQMQRAIEHAIIACGD